MYVVNGVEKENEHKKMKEYFEKVFYNIEKTYGKTVIFISLYGSQNYDMDIYTSEYTSDIDLKAVVLPSFDDFVRNKKPISTTMECDEGLCDIKDIRLMFDNYKKQNINFIETLFAKHIYVNPNYYEDVKPLFDNNELIARYNQAQAVRCMSGMSMEKVKALCHPYPSLIEKIEKYGYDPKQLYSIARLNDFIKRYIKEEEEYKNILKPLNREYLINLKMKPMPLQEAKDLANKLDKETHTLMEESLKDYRTENNQDIINLEVENLLIKIQTDVLKKKFKEELS